MSDIPIPPGPNDSPATLSPSAVPLGMTVVSEEEARTREAERRAQRRARVKAARARKPEEHVASATGDGRTSQSSLLVTMPGARSQASIVVALP